MKTLSKPEFIDIMAKNHDMSKVEAEKSLAATLDTVGKILAKGDKVSFVGFGNFYTLKSNARNGRHPQTGAPIKIKASTRPAFRAGAKLKELCN